MKRDSQKILAIDAHPLSFGFAVFEKPDQIIDWGVRSFRRGVNAVKVPMKTKLSKLMKEHQPDLILVLTPKTELSLQQRLVAKVATMNHVRLRAVSRDVVKGAFPDSHNKHELALAVASRIPVLLQHIPPKRKPWKPEHYRMSIFEAAATGLSYVEPMIAGESLHG